MIDTTTPGDPADESGDAQDEYVREAERQRKLREAEAKAGKKALAPEAPHPKADDHANATKGFFARLWDNEQGEKKRAGEILAEAGRSVVRGVGKAAVEVATNIYGTAAELGDKMGKATRLDPSRFKDADSRLKARYLNDVMSPDEPVSAKEFHDKGLELTNKFLGAEPEGGVAKAIEGIAQFATGMMMAGKALPIAKSVGAVESIVKTAVHGGIAEAVAMDPYQAKLANLAASGPSWLRDTFGKLAVNPDDSRTVAQAKSFMEGLLTTAAMDGIVQGLKGAYRVGTGAAKKEAAISASARAKLTASEAKPIEPAPAASDPVAVEQADDGSFHLVNTIQKAQEADVTLYRSEPNDLGDQGEWLKGALTPEQFTTFQSERGRLFADNVDALSNYGHGEATHTTYSVTVPADVARTSARTHADGFTEYLLPPEHVAGKAPVVGKPTTGVDLPIDRPYVPTVQAVQRAKDAVGDAEFRARATAEIEARGVAGDIDGEKAAIEDVARKIFYETERPIELVSFPNQAEAEATASSMNAAYHNSMQPRASMTDEQLAGVLQVAEALKNGATPEEVRALVQGIDFNFNYSATSDEAKSVIQAISIELPDATTIMRGRIQPHEETEALAGRILEGFAHSNEAAAQAIRRAFNNSVELPQLVDAVDLFMHGLGAKIARLGRAADAMPNNDIAHAELLAAANHMWEIHADLAGTISNVARTLEARKIVRGVYEVLDPVAEAAAKDAESALKELRKARKVLSNAEKKNVAKAAEDEAAGRPPQDYSSNARSSEFNLAKARRRAQAIIKKIEDDAKPVDDSPEAVAKAAEKAAKRNEALLNDASIQREGPLPNDLIAPKKTTNPVEDIGKLLDAEDRQLQKIIDDASKKARTPKPTDSEKAAAKAAKDANDPVGTFIKDNTPPKMSRKELRAFARAIDMAEGDPTQIMAAMHSVKKLASEPNTPGLMQSILSYRMESMLSGPKTLAVNEMSNMIVAFQMPAEIWWGGVRTTGAKRAISVEASAELRQQGADLLVGNFINMKEAWRMGAKAFRTETNMLDEMVSAVGDGGGRLSGSEGATPLERGLLTLGHLPSRLLMSRDEFWKTLAYRSNVRARSLRFARDEGLEGVELAERVIDDMATAFTIHGQAKDPIALQYARTATFQNPLEYGWGKTIQAAVIKHPSGRLVMPFVRTPVNLFRYTWERTPGLNRFTEAWRADMKAGGKQAAIAQAKTEMGMMMWGTAATLALTGRITGSGPKDPQLRKQWIAAGHQPYSLNIPGKGWVSFRRGDPVFTALGIVADVVSISGEIKADNGLEIAEAWLAAIASNVSSKSFMQSATQAMDAVASGDGHVMQKFLETTAGSFIPNIARQLDPNDTLRETRGMTDEMMARIPGFSEVLEPRRNIMGEKVMRPPGYLNRALNPFTFNGEVDDNSVQEQLLVLGKAMSVPQEKYGKVDLTDRVKYSNGQDQSPYDRMLELVSVRRGTRPNLREDLTALMKTEKWADSGKERRLMLAREMVSEHQEDAMDRMQKEFPKVKEALKQAEKSDRDALRRKYMTVEEGTQQFNP